MSLRFKRRVVGKSADYTVKYPMDAPDTTFTNDGATGAVVYTLPTPSVELLGVRYRFRAVVDQSITVATPTADTGIGLNDLAVDSLAASTAGQKIGACIEAECVKTTVGSYQWMLSGTAVGHTYSVNT